LQETPRSKKRGRQLISWVKQGIIPLDEALEDRDLGDARGEDEERWRMAFTDREGFSAVRRLKRFREMARRRERRRGGKGSEYDP